MTKQVPVDLGGGNASMLHKARALMLFPIPIYFSFDLFFSFNGVQVSPAIPADGVEKRGQTDDSK